MATKSATQEKPNIHARKTAATHLTAATDSAAMEKRNILVHRTVELPGVQILGGLKVQQYVRTGRSWYAVMVFGISGRVCNAVMIMIVLQNMTVPQVISV